jgi:hypothetical protein
VPRLSSEVEYKTLGNAAAKIMWIQSPMHELGIVRRGLQDCGAIT